MTDILKGVVQEKQRIINPRARKCWLCKERIPKGEEVLYSEGFGSVQHLECQPRMVGHQDWKKVYYKRRKKPKHQRKVTRSTKAARL